MVLTISGIDSKLKKFILLKKEKINCISVAADMKDYKYNITFDIHLINLSIDFL